jgi:ATP-dependent 26S proteasome regulatory subunit
MLKRLGFEQISNEPGNYSFGRLARLDTHTVKGLPKADEARRFGFAPPCFKVVKESVTMSDDLEGDDIWGDSAAPEQAAAAQEQGESKQEEEGKEQEQPEALEDDDTRHMSISELRQRIHLINNDIRVMKSDVQRITHDTRGQQERIRENQEKVKLNKQLPYLVANVVEILEPDAEDGLEDEELESGGAADVDANRKTRSAVVRTSTRQTIFLPVPGLVDPTQLKPSDLVGTNKDSYLILEKLPAEFDSRVQAMEVDERPSEEYSDIGGADLQIQELIEAVVLPMTHKDMFDAIGIKPPKGVLLHGPPGKECKAMLHRLLLI